MRRAVWHESTDVKINDLSDLLTGYIIREMMEVVRTSETSVTYMRLQGATFQRTVMSSV
jgi:hypothetical protein